ncbi:MAG: thiamine-phosphate synthase family protein [Candidatus Heimdallarchaeota archaeon]
MNIAKKLRLEEKKSQKEISEILGVSQPVINQYLTDDGGVSRLMIPELQEKIGSAAEEIMKEIVAGLTEERILSTLCRACKQLRTNAELCQAHKALVPSFHNVQSCMACRITEMEDLEELHHRRGLLFEVEALMESVIDLPEFERLIPAVGTQIGLSLNTALTTGDVASIPGGIVSVKGRAMPVSKHAEFGASKTTANILLKKKKLSNEINAVISLRNSAEIRSSLNNMGMQIMQTKGGDKNWSNVFKDRKSEAEEAKIIADEGEVGFEAILYLFAHNSAELKTSIIDLVRQL